MPVRGHRGEGELLRPDRMLQVEHQPHDAWLELPDPQRGDVGVVRPHLADELAQGRAQFELIDVDDHPRRLVDELVTGGEGGVGLDRHPRVLFGRPQPHGDDRCPECEVDAAQRQSRGADVAQRGAAVKPAAVHPSSVSPRGVSARTRTRRVSSSPGSIVNRRSGRGSKRPAFSGHSAIFRPGAA